jgi:hypothetical protein
MAASDYELKILTYDFVDQTKKQIECRFDWPGLADGASEYGFTDKFEIFVRYHIVNNAGERRIDREDPATTITAIPGQTEYVYYWDVPERCIEVEMRVVAYSKTYNSNGNEVPHWNVGLTIAKTTDWLYCGESNRPDKANTPTVTQDPRLGNKVVLELTDIIDPEGSTKDVKKVEFQILYVENDQDDGTIISGQHEATVSDFNTCRYVMSIGTKYGYRFRARLWASKYGSVVGVENPWAANASPIVEVPGEWSDLTEIIHGAPNSPEIVNIKKQNRTQILITLKKDGYLHHYQFQVASTQDAFTRMDTWEIEHPDLIEDDSAREAARALPPPILDEFVPEGGDTESILYTATQLPGGRLFYRVRAVSAESGGYYSGWSNVYEYKFSEELQKPIVWMNTPFASVGDNSITLNVMHNSPTGTQTTGAQIMYRINSGTLIPYPREGIIDPPANGTNVYQIPFPLTDFDEECAIYWMVRTAEYGEAGQDERNWSEFSEALIFYVYDKPILNITFPDIPQEEWIPAVTEENAQTIPVVSQFPLHFRVDPVLSGDQMITSYFVRLMAVEAYGEYDGYGNKRFVNKGEVLYQFHDNSVSIDKYLSVTDATLANGQRYILSVSAYVNTGVTVEAQAMFTVNISTPDYVIEAVVGENRENVTMIINPAAVKYEGTGLGPMTMVLPTISTMSMGFTEYTHEFIHGVDKDGVPYKGIGWKRDDRYDQHTSSPYLYYTGIVGIPSSMRQHGIEIGEIQHLFAETLNMDDEEFAQYRLDNAISIVCLDASAIVFKKGARPSSSKNGIFFSTTGMCEVSPIILSAGSTNPQIDIELNKIYRTEIPVDENNYIVGTRTILTTLNQGDRYDEYNIIPDARLSNQALSTFDENSEIDHGEIIGGICNMKLNLVKYHSDIDKFEVFGPTIDWPVVEGGESETVRTYVNDILLSVYRKNQDGTMVAIAENFENQDSIFVTDPHPNLMKNSYRIVGKDKNSGAMTFVDTPEYQMQCTDIIIQWDENVHFADVTENSLPAEYAGNTLRLPYNIDVSESANIENSMVNYVGRKNPVSYYGTQTGYTATWNTVIPKSDRDTIALLRKLQVYPGDVYVREPSGTGYWAHVTVSFPINHVELTVSVSLSITRVEGGM